ncbi:hypothetical protein POKO110462_19695 [Pontibacter korlensis]|uniref:STAS/SEC14 domain-containing protein n=1 Tax=Pontibacter korlensis TaxID=400092 RepID=A0A0E3UXD7_9BACT|nr:hypothetical protein [Pontibacter korlensis]AKD04157.1 hypothetical protein PKOR_15010 [Pontibacter korlensis]
MPETSFRPAYQIVFVGISPTSIDYMKASWLRPVSSEEYREGTQVFYQQAMAHHVSRLLIDSVRTNVPVVADMHWTSNYINSLQNLTVNRLARLLSDDIFHALFVESVEEGLQVPNLQIMYFRNEQDAVKWLMSEPEKTLG